MRIRSAMRLLPLAAVIIVLGLAFAPVSFAGEDGNSPGPTQVGEVQGPPAQSPASHQGPSTARGTSTSSSSVAGATHSVSHSTARHGVLGTQTALRTQTTGIQAGLGGASVSSSTGAALGIALVGGGMLLLAAAGSGLVPLRRRSDG